MNNNNSFNNQPNDLGNIPKKKNTGSILVVIILLLVGFGAGYFLSNENLFKKNDVKTEETNKEGKEVKADEKDEEKKETENSRPEIPAVQPKGDLKVLKEIKHDITLNNNNVLKYVAFYYSNNKGGVTKEVYLNGNKIVDLVTVSYNNSDENIINEDNKNSFEKIGYLNDTSNGKKYIVYFYDYEYVWGPQDYEVIDNATKVLLIDENANILFNKETFNSKSHYSLMVDSKAEALDRTIKEYGSVIEVYAGDDFGKKASRVEFKEDHFYSLELTEDIIYDYKYVVTNGVLNKTLLKQYNCDDEKHVKGAGA